MRHHAERDAARFLGGVMSAGNRERFSAHLLECADCWAEVASARSGRLLAESTRTAAPPALRERIRGLVEAESIGDDPVPLPPSRTGVRRWLVPVAVPAAAAAVVALIVTLGAGTTEPPSLRQAVADFTAEQLPGSELPKQRAPDLTRLRLQPVGAGGGSYAGLDVDGYAYRDPAGRRIVLYLSDQPLSGGSGSAAPGRRRRSVGRPAR